MTDVSKVTLKVLAKFAENLHEARNKVDPNSSDEHWLALNTVAECMRSALLTYDAAPASLHKTDKEAMTDLEKIELAVRRTADRAPGPWKYWLRELADEIAKQVPSHTNLMISPEAIDEALAAEARKEKP